MNESEIQEIIRQLAKKKGVSAEKITEEIQASINSAFKNPTPAALLMPKKGAVPTIQEIIEYWIQVSQTTLMR